jgi:hypothetical protein
VLTYTGRLIHSYNESKWFLCLLGIQAKKYLEMSKQTLSKGTIKTSNALITRKRVMGFSTGSVCEDRYTYSFIVICMHHNGSDQNKGFKKTIKTSNALKEDDGFLNWCRFQKKPSRQAMH